MPRDFNGKPLVPGVNVDRIDVAAGMRELTACGWGDASPETRMVVEYALTRWARGEEEAAERGAIDRSFHGIDFTSWRRVLAAARAAAEANAPRPEHWTREVGFKGHAYRVSFQGGEVYRIEAAFYGYRGRLTYREVRRDGETWRLVMAHLKERGLDKPSP